MRYRHISDGDNLFRHSVYPVSFKGGRFQSGKLWRLVDKDERTVVTSVAWQRYVPTARHIHEYGCRLALGRNQRAQLDGKYRESGRQIYCGAYQLSAQAVRALVGTHGLEEIESADVVHRIENGEIAHADLTVTLQSTGRDVEGTKTAIIVRLWTGCRGPIVHVCDGDADVTEHPSQHLTPPPSGLYVDTRSYVSRLLFLISFHIRLWCWRTFDRAERARRRTAAGI